MTRRLLIAILLSLLAATQSLATEPAGPPALERVVVRFGDDARVRLRAAGLVSLGDRDLGPVHAVLAEFGEPLVRKVFRRPELEIEADRKLAEERSGRKLPDLNSFFEILVAGEDVEPLIKALRVLPIIDTAYREPGGRPAVVDIPPPTPDFERLQGYLDPAPGTR